MRKTSQKLKLYSARVWADVRHKEPVWAIIQHFMFGGLFSRKTHVHTHENYTYMTPDNRSNIYMHFEMDEISKTLIFYGKP